MEMLLDTRDKDSTVLSKSFFLEEMVIRLLLTTMTKFTWLLMINFFT